MFTLNRIKPSWLSFIILDTVITVLFFLIVAATKSVLRALSQPCYAVLCATIKKSKTVLEYFSTGGVTFVISESIIFPVRVPRTAATTAPCLQTGGAAGPYQGSAQWSF